MGLAWRAVRSASHHGHVATRIESKPRAARPAAPAADSYAARDAAELADMRKWAGQGWQVRPRSEKAETAEGAPPPAPAMTADRPQTISDMVGQEELRNQLAIVVNGSRARGVRLPHCLIAGPAGFGKTTIAEVIAGECGSELIKSTGIVLRKPHDLAGLLLKASPGAVVFIDEVHRIPLPVAEMLYEALEDGTLSVMTGHGTDAQAVTHELPPFVCVAATTDPGRLSKPFRDRFGFRGEMLPYETEELAEIVTRAWHRKDILPDAGEAYEVARRALGVPRLALHLADRVLDYCAAHGVDPVPVGMVAEALEAFGVDQHGLTSRHWRVLSALVETFNGNPVGLDALASATDIDARTISSEIEPPLCQAGLMARTKGGRMALPLGHELYRTERSQP